jgi:lipopolysaccharide/colanic/teichoic acid biosynthesis glycosyltransferase
MSYTRSSMYQPRSATAWYRTVHPHRRLIRGKPYHRLKRAIDLLVCLLSVPLVLPLCGLISLLIALDTRGPILFLQLRTGKHGRQFRMYKFRTMVREAEQLQPAYAHMSHLAAPDFKIAGDPRITRVGRFLRRTSLDELPQLLNVLKGEMSLVGPRPTSFTPEEYLPWHTARLDVLPGITGLSQVRGRGTLSFDQRVGLDLDYIERQCLWLDLLILLRTIGQIVLGAGAY